MVCLDSLILQVYSDNRRKAEASHASLDKLSAKNELPLYNQPSDTEMYTYNKKRYKLDPGPGFFSLSFYLSVIRSLRRS